MRIAILAPIAQRTPPRQSGPRETVVSLLADGLADRGVDVTLFATEDSQTRGRLIGTCACGYEEQKDAPAAVLEGLHVSEVFERGEDFDLIHNHAGFLPLTYSGMTATPVLTTIHELAGAARGGLPVFKKYNRRCYYASVSAAGRCEGLDYIATVHNGVDVGKFAFQPRAGDDLVFCGRIHPDAGAREAIEIARRAGRRLVIAGVIEDHAYFKSEIEPRIDGEKVIYRAGAGPQERSVLLGGALALLYPVQFAEPFGLPVVEAMACGTPVVAFSRGSMPEVVEDGRTGFLVSSVGEAAAAINRAGSLDRAACRARVEERFTAERMVAEYMGVYEKILAERKREDHRPWGYYVILADEPDHKVKRIVVYPGQRLSLQRHRRRSEHWYVIEGRAVVTRNDETIELAAGQAVDIPCGAWHRIRNPGGEEMAFVEVQTGDYFGEDDIERSEDDYGRAS